jgi:hypothetical protein
VQAEERAQVLRTKVNGEKDIIQNKVQAQVVEIVNKSRADAKAMTKRTEEYATVSVIESQSTLMATKAKCHALLEEGRSEMRNIEGFDAQRKHEFEMKKAQVFQDLAKDNKNLVISGDHGDAIISSLFELDGQSK